MKTTKTSYRSREHDHLIDRAAKYQYQLREISWPDEGLKWFQNNQSIYAYLNSFQQYNERILELKERLLERIWKLAKENFTQMQFEVFTHMMDGYTQVEIAEKLNTKQSTITKVINGNCLYENGRRSKRYGGFMPKLYRLAQNDEICLDLIEEIQESEENIL